MVITLFSRAWESWKSYDKYFLEDQFKDEIRTIATFTDPKHASDNWSLNDTQFKVTNGTFENT